MRRRLFDDKQPDVASSLITLAILRIAEGKYPEALEMAQSAKGIYTAALSADHWRTALAESAEGAALTGLGRYPEAEMRLTHGYDILSKEGGSPLGLSDPGSTLLGHPAPARAPRGYRAPDKDEGAQRLGEAGFGRPLTT